MKQDSDFKFEALDFGSILNGLIKIDSVTNINYWYERLIVTDNLKGEYEVDMSAYSPEEIAEFIEVVSKLPNRLSNRMVQNYNEGSPILDAESEYEDIGRLRINVIHPSINGSSMPAISIRRTRMNVRINELDLISSGYMSNEISVLLETLVDSGCNIMIAGVTNAGKTELLRYIARFIRDNESIITIEDTREAYLEKNYPAKHVLALKSNDSQDFSALIRTSLRQNPTWICVSETRGPEVLDLLSATETGHKLISTIHADSSIAIANRMISMSKVTDGQESIRLNKQIHQNIDIGIYIYYSEDQEGAHRQIAEVCEFYQDEEGQPQSHLIADFDYENNRYHYQKIQSAKIRKNMIRKKTDCQLIKGIFI